MKGGSIAGGLVLFFIGVLVILRTVTHDDQGKNLVDKVLGLGGGSITLPSGNLQPITPKGLARALHPPSVQGRQGARHRAGKRNRAAAAGGY